MALETELQCLLQSFFSQNAFTENNLRALIAQLLFNGARDEVTREVINDTISEVNREISDLDFEIRRTIQQVDGKDIWVLCNTTSDHLTQLATVHTQNEIDYFKVLLNDIFVTNNTRRAETLAVAHMDAIRQAPRANLSKAQAEQALAQFVAEAWLQKSQHGYYSLTVRSLMELQGYLLATYNDNDDDDLETIKSCYGCKEFLTMGYRCPDLNCTCRFHFKCYEAFFNGSLRCPVCHEANWDKRDINHVGERAARYAVQNTNGSQTQNTEQSEIDSGTQEVDE